MENTEPTAADNWRELYRRVVLLDRIGQAWMFEGIVQGKAHRFLGPWITHKGNSFLRLVDEDSDGWIVGYVHWPEGEAEPYHATVEGERGPLPFATGEVESASLTSFTDEEATVLWLDLRARLTILWALWQEHVAHWRSQGFSPEERYTYGVSMHEQASLYLYGYNEEGEAVVEFHYPALSGPSPLVSYTDAADGMPRSEP